MAQTIINFCPQCGSKIILKENSGKERPRCTNCGWIHFLDPKVAAAALIIESGKVLLVRRKNNPEKGKWTLPAGFIDGGEDPINAIKRECLEETGLTVEISHLVDVISGLEHSRGADILIVYKATIKDGSLFAQDDVDLADWFAFDNLPQLAFEATKKILRSPDLIKQIP